MSAPPRRFSPLRLFGGRKKLTYGALTVLLFAGTAAGSYGVGYSQGSAERDRIMEEGIYGPRSVLEFLETDEGIVIVGDVSLSSGLPPDLYEHAIPQNCDEALAALDSIIERNPPEGSVYGPGAEDRTYYERSAMVARATCPFGVYRRYLIDELHPWLHGTDMFPTNTETETVPEDSDTETS